MFDHWGKVDGKVACAFSSSGGWGGGAEIACQSLQMVLMNFGFLVFGVTDYAGKYPTGVKVRDEQMAALRIAPATFHGEWNYTVKPRRRT